MKSTPLGILVLVVFVWSIMDLSNSAQVVADVGDPGVISIDCGINQASWDTNGFYHDADVVKFGKPDTVSPNYIIKEKDQEEQVGEQMNTLRSFPDGKRNCYSLTPKSGKNKKYLIRAFFKYGDYDLKNSTPKFDLHLGVNLWTTIDLDSAGQIKRKAVVHFSPTSNIDVCLINTGDGIPFISLLELWPLPMGLYGADDNRLPLDLLSRVNLGMPEDNPKFIRYSDDAYGRSWSNGNGNVIANSEPISTSEAVDGVPSDYKLPKGVLNSAIQSRDGSSSLVIDLENCSADYDYYVYLHFFDFEFDQRHSQNQSRNMVINFTDTIQEPISLNYWTPKTMVKTIQKGESLNRITIASAPGSTLPPMINAYETYRVLPQPNASTNEEDDDAMRKIRDAYDIKRISWQGDPCMPPEYRWEGVTCNSENIPRITKLNLSSSKLTGKIVPSFSSLTSLESLDLSNNELTGEIPESLLRPNLTLLSHGNPDLCHTGSCKTIQKFIIAIATSVAACVTILAIICIFVILYKRKRKNQSGKKFRQLKSKNQAFCHAEIVSVTNNFRAIIGEGGFGRVYLGTLQDGIQVAVKLLSKSSQQGFKEFQSEAELLTIVHHRNLVSLVGYCDDGHMKALVYEYMTEGNLRYLLSDKSPCVLTWIVRLQVALDAACGLDYLHNGCKPPIIHRDLKTSNILLGENMQAKIADFGLSRAFANDNDTYVSSQAAGTIGYLDPEFHSSGNLNKKSDVYSFGIILLELMTGRPAVTGTPGNTSHICDWVTPKLERGDIQSIIDPRLVGKYSFESAWKFLEIAMTCVPPAAIQRPDISHVVIDLKECLALELTLESAGGNSRFLNSTFDISYVSLESDSAPYAR